MFMLATSFAEATIRIIDFAPYKFLRLLIRLKDFHNAYIRSAWVVVEGWGMQS
jgi:hypothetical protein